MQGTTKNDEEEEHGQSRTFMEWGFIQAFIKVHIIRKLQVYVLKGGKKKRGYFNVVPLFFMVQHLLWMTNSFLPLLSKAK